MSVQLQQNDTIDALKGTTDKYRLPTNVGTLVTWLEEQPHIISVERECTLYRGRERYGRTRRREIGTKTVTEQVWLNPDYEESTRACHGSQAEVMDAWESMKFPSHRIESVQRTRGAYLYSWSSTTQPRGRRWGRRFRGDDDTERVINFSAVQHPDGHGVVEHYSTIAAIRTRNGLVIANEQDYGGGFAQITRPDDADATIPLTGIEDILNGHDETLYEITEIVRDSVPIRPVRSYNSETESWETTGFRPTWTDTPTLLRFSTGAAIMLLIDTTAKNSNERKCGFYIPPEEAPLYDTVEQATRSLQPITVQQAVDAGRYEITPADQFVGRGATFYDEERLGNTIIRQGEWYLVPMPEDWMPDEPIYKALHKPKRKSKWEYDHLDIDFDPVLDGIEDLPTTRCTCGRNSGDDWTIDARFPMATCDHCDATVVFEPLDESQIIDLHDWESPSVALDTLGSHVPRDVAVEDGDIFIRGTFRHTNQEHQMVNLKDRWHLAIENTRDVTVFDLDLGLGPGVALYE